MIRFAITLTAIISAILCAQFTFADKIEFDWAVVGNPGNPDDIHTYNIGGVSYSFGGVDYQYRISKHLVTNGQYTQFLNAVAGSDPNGLYDDSMGGFFGGIAREGTPGSFTYSVKPDVVGKGPGGADGDDYSYANKPVTYVSFFDVMRFMNWLENGQPTGPQGPNTTEDGVYSISDGVSEIRNPGSSYFLPNNDEWYKAAYYDPSGVYYDYPTSTDTIPNNNLPSADTGNSANFKDDLDYTTGVPNYHLTDVGAYALSTSPYGTFDQGGNVWEWHETLITVFPQLGRGWRGGSWAGGPSSFRAGFGTSGLPEYGNIAVGFRVASKIPEPTTLTLAALGLCLVASRRRR